MDGLVENPIKIDDLGVPLFSETSKSHLQVGRRVWTQTLWFLDLFKRPLPRHKIGLYKMGKSRMIFFLHTFRGFPNFYPCWNRETLEIPLLEQKTMHCWIFTDLWFIVP